MIASALRVLTVLATLSAITFLIANSDRGLDATDEGFYLVSAANPADVTMWPNSAHWLTAVLFRLSGHNVVAFRVSGVLCSLLSALLFAWGVAAFCGAFGGRSDTRGILDLASDASVVVGGQMLAYAWFLLEPSYNTVNAWALTAGTGCVLAAVASGQCRDLERRREVLWLAAAGIFVGSALLVKFPTGLALVAVFGVLIAAWPFGTLLQRTRRLGALGIGCTVTIAAYFAFSQSPTEWWRSFHGGIWLVSTLDASHGLNPFRGYWSQLRDEVIKATPYQTWSLWAVAVVGAVFLRTSDNAKTAWFRRVGGVLIGTVLLIAVAQAGVHLRRTNANAYFGDIVRFYFDWLLLLGAAFAFSRRGEIDDRGLSQRPRAWSLVVLMLVVLPFAGAVGTGNAITRSMVYSLGPWFGLFVVALRNIGELNWLGVVGQVVKTGLSAFCAIQIVGGATASPYRLNTPLNGQVVTSEVGWPATKLRLDPETAAFLERLRNAAAACGFQHGEDVLMFFDAPGVVFAMGGRSPGIPWYTAAYPGSQAVAERGLSAAGVNRIERAYLLEMPDQVLGILGPPRARISTPEWLGRLSPSGIRFPERYRLCGNFMLPYAWARQEVRLWRPLASAEQTSLMVRELRLKIDFAHWAGPKVVALQDLENSIPFLRRGGNQGDFGFARAGHDGLRIFPTTAEKSAELQVEFARNDALKVSGGDRIVMSLDVLMPAESEKTGVFIQDRDGADWQRVTVNLASGGAWRTYAVSKTLRPGMSEVSVGVDWYPVARADFLEVKNIRIYVEH